MEEAKAIYAGMPDGNVLLATLVEYCKEKKSVPAFMDKVPDELYDSIGSSLMVARPLDIVLEEEKNAVLKIEPKLVASYEKMNAPGCVGCNKRKHALAIKQFLLQKELSGLSGELIFKLNFSRRTKTMAKVKSLNVRPEMVINTFHCLNCTLKHLASAIVEMGELRKGYWNTDHEIFCMGNLAEASEQIDEYSNDIAMELRSLRIDIFETQKMVTEEHLVLAKDLFWKIKKIADPDVQIKAVESIKVSKNMQNHYRAAQAQAQLDVKIGVKPSGCGCKRRSAEAVPNRQ